MALLILTKLFYLKLNNYIILLLHFQIKQYTFCYILNFYYKETILFNKATNILKFDKEYS